MADLQSTYILDVDGLNIYYGSFQAVKNVSFHVKPGEIFGLLGPNGAGKTSILSAIEGLLNPQSGNIVVAGHNIKEKPLSAVLSELLKGSNLSFEEVGTQVVLKKHDKKDGSKLDPSAPCMI